MFTWGVYGWNTGTQASLVEPKDKQYPLAQKGLGPKPRIHHEPVLPVTRFTFFFFFFA